MAVNARTEEFQHIEVFDKPALFTNGRIARDTVPKGWYCYDIRGSDDDPGELCYMEENVVVNHAGSVLMPEKLAMPKSGRLDVRDELGFLDEGNMTLREFCEARQLSYPAENMKFHIRPARPEEAGLFYTPHPEEDKRLGTVGHVRMDFGRSGNEFRHTWWPRGPEELNSPAFKLELQEVVDTLRESVLKNRFAMERFCYEHGGKISGGYVQNYGYIVETEHYRYCLRCNPSPGDYNGYLTCFNLNVQRQNMARDKPLVGHVSFANSDTQEFTDAEAFLKCVREELPYRPTTGFRYEVLTDDPAVRKAVDDIRLGLPTFEDEGMQDDPELETQKEEHQSYSVYEQAQRYRAAKAVLQDIYALDAEHAEAVKALEQLWEEGYTVAAHQLGKFYRDDLSTLRDYAKAEQWFRRSAEAGNDFSEYALGKLLLTQKRWDEAMEWLDKAADHGSQFAQYRLGKISLTGEFVPKDVEKALAYLTASADQGNQFAQYALGKLYLFGRDAPSDREQAREWLIRAAAQGNEYARFFLDRFDQFRDPSVMLAATKLLHHMSRIFQSNSVPPSNPAGIRIDSKRRRRLMEKRMAMGHKADDREEQTQYQQSMYKRRSPCQAIFISPKNRNSAPPQWIWRSFCAAAVKSCFPPAEKNALPVTTA